MKAPTTSTMQIRIDPKLKLRFKKLAVGRGHDMTRIAVTLIETWCDRIEARMPKGTK